LLKVNFLLFAFLLSVSAWSAPMPMCDQNPVTLAVLNHVENVAGYRQEDFTTWSFTHKTEAKGLAIVHHGLNLRPSRMRQVDWVLNDLGIDVLNVGSFGHRGNIEEMKAVTQQRWIKDLYDTYCIAYRYAKIQGIPMYMVGFSIGALLYQSMMNNPALYGLATPVDFEKVVMFAPAFALTFKTNFMRMLTFLPSSTIISSWANSNYRANDGTSIAAYEALFKTKSELVDMKFAASNVPTLVIADPNDSVVDTGEIEDIITEYKLDQWKTIHVNTDEGNVPSIYHHLLVVEEALGQRQWKIVTDEIKRHLSQ
jgi:esterase/lipase